MDRQLPEIQYVDRVTLQLLMSLFCTETRYYMEREGGMVHLRDPYNERFSFLSFTGRHGVGIDVYVNKRSSADRSNAEKTAVIYQTIDDYLNSDSPHPTVVFSAFVVLASETEIQNPQDRFYMINRLRSVMDTMVDKYGSDVFLRARNVEVNTGVYSALIHNFSHATQSPTDIIRSITSCIYKGFDMDKSRQYIDDLFTCFDYVLKPVERILLIPKLNTFLDSCLRGKQRGVAHVLDFISPITMQEVRPDDTPYVNVSTRSDDPDFIAFAEKMKAHVDQMHQVVPDLLKQAFESRMTLQGVVIDDLLLDSFEKLKVGTVKEVLEHQCHQQGVESVRDSLVDCFLQRLLLKARELNSTLPLDRMTENPFHTASSAFGMYRDKMISNLGIALAELDRINPEQGSVVEHIIDRLVELSQQGEAERYQAGFGFRMLVDTLNQEENRFMKPGIKDMWAIKLETALLNYLAESGIEKDDTFPVISDALISAHLQRRMVCEQERAGEKAFDTQDLDQMTL
jgi:hypothetical protein